MNLNKCIHQQIFPELHSRKHNIQQNNTKKLYFHLRTVKRIPRSNVIWIAGFVPVNAILFGKSVTVRRNFSSI